MELKELLERRALLYYEMIEASYNIAQEIQTEISYIEEQIEVLTGKTIEEVERGN